MSQQPRRGRPVGRFPSNKIDQPLLHETVLLLANGKAKTPTAAFRMLIGEDDDAHLRRLQRRWQQNGDRLVHAHDDNLRQGRLHLEEKSFKESAPKTHAQIMTFANSPAGAELLEQIAGRAVHPLAFGLPKLLELQEATAPRGSAKADTAFAEAQKNWARFGSRPDPAFLLRFAELCRDQANLYGEEAS